MKRNIKENRQLTVMRQKLATEEREAPDTVEGFSPKLPKTWDAMEVYGNRRENHQGSREIDRWIPRNLQGRSQDLLAYKDHECTHGKQYEMLKNHYYIICRICDSYLN